MDLARIFHQQRSITTVRDTRMSHPFDSLLDYRPGFSTGTAPLSLQHT